MLAKITDDLYIDLSQVYLVERDEHQANELIIYIKYHPKVPIILKDEQGIGNFKRQFDNYMFANKLREPHEPKHTAAQNVQSPSENLMAVFDPGPKARIQPHDETIRQERANDDESDGR